MQEIMKENMQELTMQELDEVSGGIVWVAVGVAAIAVVGFGIGVYNGYKNAENAAK